jgi:hypothetical protein
MSAREVVPGKYSVTEILKPPRIVNFNRQVHYYSSPQSLMFMQFGTAFHTIVEGQRDRCPGHQFERQLHFEAEIEVGDRRVIVAGTPDQYDYKTDILTDYKTSGFYAIKLLMEGKWSDSDYQKQVNLYRFHKFPACKKMQLVFLVKDYTRKMKNDGVSPLITIAVPKIPDDEVAADEKIRLFDILDGENDWTKSRDCTEAERWKHWKTGEYVRCQDYCVVKSECPQFRGEK